MGPAARNARFGGQDRPGYGCGSPVRWSEVVVRVRAAGVDAVGGVDGVDARWRCRTRSTAWSKAVSTPTLARGGALTHMTESDDARSDATDEHVDEWTDQPRSRRTVLRGVAAGGASVAGLGIAADAAVSDPITVPALAADADRVRVQELDGAPRSRAVRRALADDAVVRLAADADGDLDPDAAEAYRVAVDDRSEVVAAVPLRGAPSAVGWTSAGARAAPVLARATGDVVARSTVRDGTIEPLQASSEDGWFGIGEAACETVYGPDYDYNPSAAWTIAGTTAAGTLTGGPWTGAASGAAAALTTEMCYWDGNDGIYDPSPDEDRDDEGYDDYYT